MTRAVAAVTMGALAIVAACDGFAPTGVGPSGTSGSNDTLFAEDFESGTLSTWQDGIDPARHRVITDAASAHAGSRYLAVSYPAGHDGGWLTHFLAAPSDSLYVSYYVRFPQQWRGGTKLIGFYGSRADDQWSAFGKAGRCPNGTDFVAAMLVADAGGDPGPARFYTYYPAMRREPDGVTCWGRFGDGSETYTAPSTLSRGTWHHVEFAVTLNTPGRADARQVFWLDGVERGRWSGFSFRDGEVLRLNSVQLTFSAAADTAAREVHVDDLVVSSRRP